MNRTNGNKNHTSQYLYVILKSTKSKVHGMHIQADGEHSSVIIMKAVSPVVGSIG